MGALRERTNNQGAYMEEEWMEGGGEWRGGGGRGNRISDVKIIIIVIIKKITGVINNFSLFMGQGRSGVQG